MIGQKPAIKATLLLPAPSDFRVPALSCTAYAKLTQGQAAAAHKES